ncbi:hypothetical protein FOZ63_033470 [Perkinsus olseni]|uniref:Thioredoxin domain-containing protein n=2 Tax=Perkinsus olseni TaxID=32597 RepID=A0A7J6R522_PEROL|nr:hypothetical protein FOZ60_013916 [Perkinsus olseni]KAF4715774.1 hypothetical protein FOZ63_033470 [Perkinsus olseni]
MTVAHINTVEGLDKAFADNGDKLVVVDYFASWCGPCVTMGPKFEAMAGEFDGKAVFIKVDVDEAEDAAEKADIQVLPTFILYKEGKEVSRMSGASDAKLHDLIQANC